MHCSLIVKLLGPNGEPRLDQAFGHVGLQIMVKLYHGSKLGHTSCQRRGGVVGMMMVDGRYCYGKRCVADMRMREWYLPVYFFFFVGASKVKCKIIFFVFVFSVFSPQYFFFNKSSPMGRYHGKKPVGYKASSTRKSKQSFEDGPFRRYYDPEKASPLEKSGKKPLGYKNTSSTTARRDKKHHGHSSSSTRSRSHSRSRSRK